MIEALHFSRSFELKYIRDLRACFCNSMYNFPGANSSFCLSVFPVVQIVSVSVVVVGMVVGAEGLLLTGDNHCLKSTNTTMTFSTIRNTTPIAVGLKEFCSDRCQSKL